MLIICLLHLFNPSTIYYCRVLFSLGVATSSDWNWIHPGLYFIISCFNWRSELESNPSCSLEVWEYPGAYKITKGLLEKYVPERVLDTPITEDWMLEVLINAGRRIKKGDEICIIHFKCEGCVQKVKKLLQKIDGTYIDHVISFAI
ncbi:uncharacterized protein LOC130726042 [Lotus japonicus]|uniref:uncharacterized protein LOC130726042 n=1 Tax=Lotus japonicus TaxID=34305 RepID=UPI00258EFC26|nr:uncharacterized protein LOC130726042 [Lotus japonicus]XP_057433236.1 uncharacterized protein LOC130726042 [Lotus japonicus]